MISPESKKSSGSKRLNLNPLLPEPVDFQGFFDRKKIKVRNHLYQRLRTFVVEVRGVEPLSESTSSGPSPGADIYLDSPARTGNVTLTGSVASLCMARAKLNVRTFTTNRRPYPGRGTPGKDGR